MAKLLVNIVGSKPINLIPWADAHYFVNNALIGQVKVVNQSPIRCTIVAASGLHIKSNRSNMLESEKFCQQLSNFSGLIDEAVIVSNSLATEIGHLPKGIKYTCLTKAERESLIKSISGLTSPLIPTKFWEIKDLTYVKTMLDSVYNVLSSRYTGEFVDFPPLFRCSTGVLGLVVAISRYGDNCEYRLCGIGISNRKERTYISASTGEFSESHRACFDRSLQDHVYSDVKVIKALQRNYDVAVMDDELRSVLTSSSEEFG
jgi:hypothetical protein